MSDKEDVLMWEHRQAGGDGTAIYCQDPALVRALEQLLPGGFDLDQMVADGEAIAINKCYLLTDKGYEKFVVAAVQQHKDDVVATLREKKNQYWFRVG